VYGFNVSLPEHVSAVAKSHNVPVLMHKVIYKLIADVKDKLSERLQPLEVEETVGEFFSVKSDLFLLKVVDVQLTYRLYQTTSILPCT